MLIGEFLYTIMLADLKKFERLSLLRPSSALTLTLSPKWERGYEDEFIRLLYMLIPLQDNRQGAAGHD
jgi:hypothetical protein